MNVNKNINIKNLVNPLQSITNKIVVAEIKNKMDYIFQHIYLNDDEKINIGTYINAIYRYLQKLHFKYNSMNNNTKKQYSTSYVPMPPIEILKLVKTRNNTNIQQFNEESFKNRIRYYIISLFMKDPFSTKLNNSLMKLKEENRKIQMKNILINDFERLNNEVNKKSEELKLNKMLTMQGGNKVKSLKEKHKNQLNKLKLKHNNQLLKLKNKQKKELKSLKKKCN